MKTLKQLKKCIEESELFESGAAAASLEYHKVENWSAREDNTKLGSNPAAISRKISEHHNFKDSSDIVETIKHYTADESSDVNNHLIKKHKDPSYNKPGPYRDHIINTIKKHIHKNKLKHDLHTYSGTSFDPSEHVKNGMMHSPAFISASHDKDVALSFARKPGPATRHITRHIIHFHLKKGDPALHVEKYSDVKNEHETIIAPSKLKYHHKEIFHYHNYDDDIMNEVHVHHMSIAK